MVTEIYNDANYIEGDTEKVIYFDIETTGFDKENDKIIMISYGKFCGDGFVIKQFFADSLYEEKKLLIQFSEDIQNNDTWCSYNGIAFDEPFIKKRMNLNKIHLNLPEEHVDLYRLIRPYYKNLGMERCNLKSVENFLGIHRKDMIDGGLSVDLYNEYLDTKNDDLKKIIMLHNYEDVLNLPTIHKFALNVNLDKTLVKDNGITTKQSKYLEFLLEKYSLELCISVNEMSKKAASKVIDRILNGSVDSCELNKIVNNSY